MSCERETKLDATPQQTAKYFEEVIMDGRFYFSAEIYNRKNGINSQRAYCSGCKEEILSFCLGYHGAIWCKTCLGTIHKIIADNSKGFVGNKKVSH